MQVFVKVGGNDTVVVRINPHDQLADLKDNIAEKLHNIDNHDIIMVCAGKQLQGDRTAGYYNIQEGAHIHVTARLRGGGLSDDEVKAAFGRMEMQFQQIQAAPAHEQSKTEELKRIIDKKSSGMSEGGGIVAAIRKGQVKDISSKEFASTQASGSVQAWARQAKDFLYWHDPQVKGLVEEFETKWPMDERLTHEKILEICSGCRGGFRTPHGCGGVP